MDAVYIEGCSECGTKATPLWRFGPRGPRTMCNACGIRWKRKNGQARKKRRLKKAAPFDRSSDQESSYSSSFINDIVVLPSSFKEMEIEHEECNELEAPESSPISIDYFGSLDSPYDPANSSAGEDEQYEPPHRQRKIPNLTYRTSTSSVPKKANFLDENVQIRFLLQANYELDRVKEQMRYKREIAELKEEITCLKAILKEKEVSLETHSTM